MPIISAANTDTWKGLFWALKEKGYNLPSKDIMIFETSQLSDSSFIPENVLNNDIQTYWASTEYNPYFTMNFGKNKVSLSGFTIYGIANPYTIAFNISGSNNGYDWHLIKEYTNLGEKLYGKQYTFKFNELTDLFHYIKIQSIYSKFLNGEITSSLFGMYDLEIYGVFISHNYFVCLKSLCFTNLNSIGIQLFVYIYFINK